MTKKELINYLEKKDDQIYSQYKRFCFENKVDEKTSRKANRLLHKWLAIEDLIDDLENDLVDD